MSETGRSHGSHGPESFAGAMFGGGLMVSLLWILYTLVGGSTPSIPSNIDCRASDVLVYDEGGRPEWYCIDKPEAR